MRTEWKLADQGAAFFNFAEKLAVLFGIDDVHSSAQHADRRAMRRPAGSRMRRTVNPARHAAHNRQTPLREILSQPFGHLIAVWRGAACSHHRYGVLVERARVAANIEQRRRIVDFKEALRIFRFVPIQQDAANLADSGELLFRVLVRAPRVYRLGWSRRQAAGLELRQRGAKNSFRRTELAQKFSGQARA